MANLVLKTDSGEEPEPTPQRVAEALQAVDRATDPGSFAVVERDDGVFVQLAAEGPLEVGGEAALPQRLDHAELARQMVARLAKGEPLWGALPHWDTAVQESERARERRRSWLYIALMLLAFAVFGAVIGWVVKG